MKKILIVIMVLVMMLSFSACTEGEEAGMLTAEEVVAKVMAAQQDIKTAEYDMDMVMDMTVEAEGESFTMDMVMSMDYAIDIEERELQADITMDVEMVGEEGLGIGMEMYVVDDTMYMMMEYPGMGEMWMKSEMPAEMWTQMNQIEPQLELLKTADVKISGSEKVNGVDCYVVELTELDIEQLWELAMQQGSLTGQEMIPEINTDLIEEIFRDFSMKQWIAKDTFLLAKAVIIMSMELTPEAMGVPGEEGSVEMDMTMIMVATGYNQPVSIELPAAAANAQDMHMFMQ